MLCRIPGDLAEDPTQISIWCTDLGFCSLLLCTQRGCSQQSIARETQAGGIGRERLLSPSQPSRRHAWPGRAPSGRQSHQPPILPSTPPWHATSTYLLTESALWSPLPGSNIGVKVQFAIYCPHVTEQLLGLSGVDREAWRRARQEPEHVDTCSLWVVPQII